MSSKKLGKTGDYVAKSQPIYAAPMEAAPVLSKVDEDEQDLAVVNKRIRAIQKGESRLVSGQELKKRLDLILSS